MKNHTVGCSAMPRGRSALCFDTMHDIRRAVITIYVLINAVPRSVDPSVSVVNVQSNLLLYASFVVLFELL